ncbi:MULTISPECIES: hypothetical protein [Methylobacterium]|jgi:hypothetical protein|uniref:hypothetical protein n=1 Tax=Methylobacterium TaxID=407 RepID=UPI0008E91113|nr:MULTISPECIES: hypothetical protein [Methylobacterium]MBZ6414265.1 hypothetical protein [Methylobacterium sp.]MBK3398346.1 hypothetical protein [Methylobacterium ajmalii]MBK3408437.1 hypothetical protein [Methylobacterium ajmalii]MBK3422893.1 hypothetical protein [Methylobacterium ajmalii]SFE47313.1 hypothetical protein SAMN04487844_103276 [Methylobacterium sp. yr596]
MQETVVPEGPGVSEKKRRATAAEIRERAFLDVIDWLDYRVAVCRDGLERYSASHGADSRAAAAERAAAFEAELILREIRKLAEVPPRSRTFREAAEARRRYVAAQASRIGEPEREA